MLSYIKTAIIVASVTQMSGVLAHGFVKTVTIDGKAFPGSNPFNAAAASASIVWPQTGGNGPLLPASIAGPEIACGRVSGPATISANANAGSSVEFDWNGSAFWPAGDAGLGPQNHHGPVMTYLAKCPGACKDATPQSLDFFKFQEEGRINTAAGIPGFWGSDKLTQAGSKVTVKLPLGLAAGEYIMRHEILALHDAMNRDPQFYPMCSNLIIAGDGSAPLPATGGARFPGAYNLATDPNLSINIFDPASLAINYVAPGPRPIAGAPARKREAFACRFARSNKRSDASCA